MIDFEKELANYGLTKELYELCLTDISDKVLGNNDLDWADIIEKYNLPIAKDTLRKASSQSIFGNVFVSEYFKNKNINSQINKSDNVEQASNAYRFTSSINKDGTITSDKLIEISEDALKNPNSLLKAHGFDTKEWELVSAKNNVWNVYSKKDGVCDLYSSKIVVKPRTNISLDEIKEFYEGLITEYSSPIVKKYVNPQNGMMLLLPIMDLHLGKFSECDIVGDSSYNSQSAREYFNYIIDNVISRVQEMNIDKIIFPIGNDFFHYDRADGCTTKGTSQDIDSKHQSLFKDGVTLLIDGISKLSKELGTTVEVFYVPGNHDMVTSYHALMSLWCYFHNNENVIVDTMAAPRHYIEYGNSLLGFTHGDKEKKRISGIMQVEAREAWGRTKYHEWILGHLHSEHTTEENGVIIRHLSSVTGIDTWHHESGFVGAIRKCTCSLWDKEYGLDSMFNIVIN